jgi:hypothetical protein
LVWVLCVAEGVALVAVVMTGAGPVEVAEVVAGEWVAGVVELPAEGGL